MQEPINQEVIPADQPSFDSLLGKWLRFLFPVSVASLVLTLLGALEFAPKTVSVLSCAMLICATVAFFSMAPANKSYRTAAILRCVVIFGAVCTLVGFTWLSFVFSVCAIIANYMEYKAHSQVIAPVDAKFSRQWMNLFVWQLVAGLLAGFLTAAGAVIAMITGVATASITRAVVIITVLVSASVQVFYLIYLKKMQWYFSK